MSTITKERLEQLANFRGAPVTRQEEQELARIALASLEADSKLSDFVASQESLGVDFERVLAENMEELYVPSKSTPPAPVSDSLLSELLGIAKRAAAEAEECAHAEFSDDSMKHSSAIADWERRAAMLRGADGNSPVTPDGVCPICGRKQLKNRTCSVSGCDGKHVARGFCIKHYAIERKKDPSRRESTRAADKRYRARKAAAPQQEVK